MRKKEELKFKIQQKQQLLQQQQKHAEAYNLAHPGQFASIYNTHGSIHHVLPEEYDDLMPDPMHYVSMMTVAPPPPPENQQMQTQPIPQIQPIQNLRFEDEENVLPPGYLTVYINFQIPCVS